MLRPIRQSFALFALAVLFLCAMYLYFFFYFKNSHDADIFTNKRCLTELESLKYQLRVVTEYKNHLDKLLTETQRKCDTEKESFKEIMDSCLAMKQQTAICQSQFEDLQVECKVLKEEYDKLKKGMEKSAPAG